MTSNLYRTISGTARPGRQLKARGVVLAILYGLTLLFLGATVVAQFQTDVPIGFFSRDPTFTLDGHPLTGVQSTVGVLLWWGAAGVCFFACALLRREQASKQSILFIFWSGVISAVLAIDDVFLVHEDLAYRYLGVDEKVVLIVYGTLLLGYCVKFRRNIFSTDSFLLLLAFTFFGLSTLIDVFNSQWGGRVFIEEGLKLFGIVTWSAYQVTASFHALTEETQESVHQALAQDGMELSAPSPC